MHTAWGNYRLTTVTLIRGLSYFSIWLHQHRPKPAVSNLDRDHYTGAGAFLFASAAGQPGLIGLGADQPLPLWASVNGIGRLNGNQDSFRLGLKHL